MKYCFNYLVILIGLMPISLLAQSPDLILNANKFTVQSGFCDEFNNADLESSHLWMDTWGESFTLGNKCLDGTPHATYFSRNLFNLGGPYPVYAPSDNFKIGPSSDASCHAAQFTARWNSTPLSGTAYPGNTNHCTGKEILSRNLFYYGFFEIKAKFPNTNTSTGQEFWLYRQFCPEDEAPATTYKYPHPSWINTGGNTAFYSEIDMFEIDNSTPSTCYSSLHFKQSNDCAAFLPMSEVTIPVTVSNLAVPSAWHTYGLNWQPTFVDYYIDGRLILHQDLTTTTVPINLFKPMNVDLSCIVVCPDNAPYPLDGEGKTFEVDYFRYFKANPEVSLTLAGASLSAKAIEGIPDEDYSWVNLTTGLPISSTYNSSESNAPLTSLATGVNVIQVSSATGASKKVDPNPFNSNYLLHFVTALNPLTTGITKFKVMNPATGSGCWDICSGDIDPAIDVYYAKCISSCYNGGTYSAVVIPNTRNIKYIANQGIELDKGFEVQAGASFEAINQ